MALTYKIDKYSVDPNDATKTKVGFRVTDDAGHILIIDKSVTTGSNSAEQIVEAAQAAGQAEIDQWASDVSNIGKIWNPETNSFQE
tara:strand:+ start:629 stop:886 length:258 start_codon:yes stop_codon:yes gene_type:complete